MLGIVGGWMVAGLVVGDSPEPAAMVARAAIIVGANHAPPGRKRLRFAHEDARETAEVLLSTGGFSDEEVVVLLDPTPEAVLMSLDRAITRLAKAEGESLLLFHYSGHADFDALYPGGQPLIYRELRSRLDNPAAGVRVGVIDACRGGGWTGARGLAPAEPFEVTPLGDLDSEGSVLIASSSGLEDAHESDALRGGFFTHHWNAALRGAADRNQDQTITLTEAFEYAKERTIRDSALNTGSPQRPSYRMQLKGRSDLPLARLAVGTTALEIDQAKLPLQLVDLGSGRLVAEIPEGSSTIRLSLPAGPYLLREGAGGERATTLEISANQTTIVRQDELEVVGDSGLMSRTSPPRPVNASSLPGGKVHMAVAAGLSTEVFRDTRVGPTGSPTSGSLIRRSTGSDGIAEFHWGLTDRWHWAGPLPAFVYRGGSHGGFEWLPWAGALNWSSFAGLEVGLGADFKWWLGPRNGFTASVGTRLGMRVEFDGSFNVVPNLWRAHTGLGYSQTIGDLVTLHFGLRYHHAETFGADPLNLTTRFTPTVGLGSVLQLGLRQLPTMRVHFDDTWTLDGYFALDYDFSTTSFEESYLVGVSVTF